MRNRYGLIAVALFAGVSVTASSAVLAETQKIDLVEATAAEKAAWSTEEAERGQLALLAIFDSSGDDAWDPAAHPLVYFTSEGRGYGHRPSTANELPGVQVIDANTKEVITSMLYDFGTITTFTPHGLGISPDGQWIYIGTGDKEEGGKADYSTLVINARTLKLDKVLYLTKTHTGRNALHHGMAFTDWMDRDRVVLQYGFGATGGPHFIMDPKDDNRVVQAITFDNVRPMGHPYVAVDPTGRYLYVSVGSNLIRDSKYSGAAVAKIDLETMIVSMIPGTGHHPIGIVNTSDGRYTYVVDGHGSHVYKIDNELDEVVGSSSAGVAGPYGGRLSWGEDEFYSMGKGEGSHNVGGVVGVVDTKTMRATRAFNQPIQMGGAIIDHGIMHPDPAKNELWISSAGTWETVVVNMTSREVVGRIPSPNGGDTHNGGFVRYNPDFTGVLLADHSGPTGPEGWATALAAKVYADENPKATVVVPKF